MWGIIKIIDEALNRIYRNATCIAHSLLHYLDRQLYVDIILFILISTCKCWLEFLPSCCQQAHRQKDRRFDRLTYSISHPCSMHLGFRKENEHRSKSLSRISLPFVRGPRCCCFRILWFFIGPLSHFASDLQLFVFVWRFVFCSSCCSFYTLSHSAEVCGTWELLLLLCIRNPTGCLCFFTLIISLTVSILDICDNFLA